MLFKFFVIVISIFYSQNNQLICKYFQLSKKNPNS